MTVEILALIKEFGFPAVVSGALAYFIMFLMKQQKEWMREHREERNEDRLERKEISITSIKANDGLANAIKGLEQSLRDNRR